MVPTIIVSLYYPFLFIRKGEKMKQFESLENGNVSEEEKIFPDNLREPVSLKPVKAFFFYLSMMMVITVGFITLALQFVTINFFNVKIEKN
jgi:hypothetical protein